MMAGLYIHIPFCAGKCPYCDFVSIPWRSGSEEAYICALMREMTCLARLPEVSGLVFDTLYIGGGTPTVIPVRSLLAIIEAALASFSWNLAQPEITVEANPETLAQEMARELRASGVNRLSVGVQDLSEKGLKVLGRHHTVSDAVAACRVARDAGFPVLGVDLIYGWPGHEKQEWKRTLETLAAFVPDHISCYELTIEENTAFGRAAAEGMLRLPGQERLLVLTDLMERFLSALGYEQYEISNFALPGRRCRHNLNYWENGPYLGLGCSAVSFLPPCRSRNTGDVARYIRNVLATGSSVEDIETLDPEARFRESMILGLRLTEGILMTDFYRRWGFHPLSYYGETMETFFASGLLAQHGDRLLLTDRGRRIANRVLRELV